jgi:hypothetical protein
MSNNIYKMNNKEVNSTEENYKEYIDENGIKTIERTIYIIKEDNKWKAQKTYYEKNKEVLIKKIIESKRNRYKNDEEYREKVKSKMRENYAKKKELK